MSYEREPRYRLAPGTRIDVGPDQLAADIGRLAPAVVAMDGPAAVDWPVLIRSLSDRLADLGRVVATIDVRDFLKPWTEIERRTDRGVLRSDPVFATVFDGTLSDLFTTDQPTVGREGPVTVLFGPGSALLPHDILWYADLPKRLALEAIASGRARNIGQPPGATGTVRRLLFIDWTMEDRHRRSLSSRWDRYVDASNAREPRSLAGDVFRSALRDVASAPFRPIPTFQTQPWGGRWLHDVLGVPSPTGKIGLGFEVLAPEHGVCLTDGDADLEVSFETLMALEAGPVLGARALAQFGPSFPIRFDYLDTVDGGNLSVHCHPQTEYMRHVFGWPYTQHESYYVVATRPAARIFLGLRDDADVAAFRDSAATSRASSAPFPIDRFVRTFPAVAHQLYLIPAGTPHGSGEGSVVLEISSTPYLYSLRFYDWVRADRDGTLRPVQLEHAFANLDPGRRGAEVGQLVREPSVVRTGPGFIERDLGRHPGLFFAVRRLDLEGGIAPEDTVGGVHVLALVEGRSAMVETARGDAHPLAFGESLIVPASVGAYRVRPIGEGPHKVIKAFVGP